MIPSSLLKAEDFKYPELKQFTTVSTNSYGVWTPNEINISREPGIYFLGFNDKLVYIGISVNVQHRISEHLRGEKCFSSVSVLDIYNKDLESEYINFHKPMYNIVGTIDENCTLEDKHNMINSAKVTLKTLALDEYIKVADYKNLLARYKNITVKSNPIKFGLSVK